MNYKMFLPLIYGLVFLATNIFSSKMALLRVQDLGQVIGLGGVVVGYFVGKRVKK